MRPRKTPLTTRVSSRPRFCTLPGRGPCAVTLPGQEKEPPGLGRAGHPALRVLARLKRHEPGTKRSGWRRLCRARIISGFQPISSCCIRSPGCFFPRARAAQRWGSPGARASHSLQPGAPERWGLASGALGWGKVLNMGKLQ